MNLFGLIQFVCLLCCFASPVHAACGNVSQASYSYSGYVTSHTTHGTDAYSSNMDCQWTVTLPSSSRNVRVTVSSLTLAAGDCLRVMRSSDGVEVASVCGGTATGTLTTLTSTGVIRFTSDATSQAAGFELALTPISSSGCYSSSNMYSTSGSFSSHSDFGISRYTTGLSCIWYIQVPGNMFVRAHFSKVSVDSCCDKVELYDGTSTTDSSKLITSLTGSFSTNRSYVSSGKDMAVKFTSSGSGTGFHVYYEALSQGEAYCGSVSQASNVFSSHGSVTSHLGFGTSNYSPNMNCEWTVIMPSSGTYVQVNVSSLTLAAGDCLRVMRSSDGTELTSVCDGTVTGTLITLTSTGRIRFTSDATSQAAGFQLTLIPNSDFTGCSSSTNFTSNSGRLSSHAGVGMSNYGNNLNCYWFIQVPASPYIRVWFISASLESGFDKVYLYDGAFTNSSSIITTFTGSLSSSNNRSHLSSGSSVVVYFHTDSLHTASDTGFQLYFEATRQGHAACGSIDQAGISSSGSVTSHSLFGTSSYSQNMNCEWTVIMPSSDVFVSVIVSSLTLAVGDCLRVMRSSDGVELASVCDGTATGTLVILTSTGLIRFTSDSTSQTTGFQLILSPTNTSGCTGNTSLQSSSGIISSHSAVGQARYGINLKCQWLIQAPTDVLVRAWLISASLESCCDILYFNLYNRTDINPSADNNSMADTNEKYISVTTVFTGTLTSSNNRSYESWNNMTIQFTSGTSGSGFRLYYEVVSEAEGASSGANQGETFRDALIGVGIGLSLVSLIAIGVAIYTSVKLCKAPSAEPTAPPNSPPASATRRTQQRPSANSVAPSAPFDYGE